MANEMNKRPKLPILPKGPELTPEQNRLLLEFFKAQAKRIVALGEAPLMRQVAVPNPSGGHLLVTIPVDD
jgi:hypothetical protein